MNKNKKTPNNKDAVNFGFQKVTAKQKRLLVDEVFSDVAGTSLERCFLQNDPKSR